MGLVLVAFVPKLLVPLMRPSLGSVMLKSANMSVPFFTKIKVNCLTSLIVTHLFVLGRGALELIVVKLKLRVLTVYLLGTNCSDNVSSILLKLKLKLVVPRFLIVFMGLSRRYRQNATGAARLLTNRTNVALKVTITYCVSASASRVFCVKRVITSITLLFFILVACPCCVGGGIEWNLVVPVTL